MQFWLVLLVALGQHAQPSRNLILRLLEFPAPACRECRIIVDVLTDVIRREHWPPKHEEDNRENWANRIPNAAI
jgi:hypothetical protein